MVKLGFCTNLLSSKSDLSVNKYLEIGKVAGFDYVELPLSQLAEYSQDSFNSLKKTLADLEMDCETCNNFFPPNIKLTGNDANMTSIKGYLSRALARAGALGVKVIVLGSPRSKNIPEGFPRTVAESQFVEALDLIDSMVGSLGITVVLEPLAMEESNFLTTASQVLTLLDKVRKPNIELLIDFYHMTKEGEKPEIVTKAAGHLRHVHFSDPNGRKYPVKHRKDYDRFFSNLKTIGYDQRISVEAFTDDFVVDSKLAVDTLRSLL